MASEEERLASYTQGQTYMQVPTRKIVAPHHLMLTSQQIAQANPYFPRRDKLQPGERTNEDVMQRPQGGKLNPRVLTQEQYDYLTSLAADPSQTVRSVPAPRPAVSLAKFDELCRQEFEATKKTGKRLVKPGEQ